MLFDSISPTVRALSKLESILSNPVIPLSTKFMQSSKSIVVISAIFTKEILSQETISSSIRSHTSPIKVLSGDYSNSVTSSGFTSNSSFFAISTTSACNAGDLGSILVLGRSLGEGKSHPLQYSGLENSMDWIDHGVAKSQTRLSDSLLHAKNPTTSVVTFSSKILYSSKSSMRIEINLQTPDTVDILTTFHDCC